MRHREPPPIALWMLEHLTSGDRDEALAGDLLEVFEAGRSTGWYWRQALAACVVSWAQSLRARISLLLFTLVWSLLAPAWKALVDRIENLPDLERVWPMFGPVWVLPAFASWLLLQAVFLWAGILLFSAFNRRSLVGGKVNRALRLAPLVFAPAFGITFALTNLYWYSFFANIKTPISPLGQIIDANLLADVIRFPYIVALLWGLWAAVPGSIRRFRPSLAGASTVETVTNFEDMEPAATPDAFTIRRFLGFEAGAGLVNAMLVSLLLARLFERQTTSLSLICGRAICYVAAGVLGGAGGAWLYWKHSSSPFRFSTPVPFPLFALVCSAAWAWVPATMILTDQASPATPLVAMFTALVLASCARRVMYYGPMPEQGGATGYTPHAGSLFAESLYRPRGEAHGYLVAIGLYAGSAEMAAHSYDAAAALLAFSGFLFAWKATIPKEPSAEAHLAYQRAVLRLAYAAIPAVLVTIWALLEGTVSGNRIGWGIASNAANHAATGKVDARKSATRSAAGFGGYESVILWPYPQKKQIIAPLEFPNMLLAPGTSKPLIIRFDGNYWYLQPPDTIPGPEAHEAHGTPLGANVKSNNDSPIMMDAHQKLGAAIPISRCREIQVEIANQDNRMGVVSVAVLLTYDKSSEKSAAYLGQQPIPSTVPRNFSIKSAPVFETLRFMVPANVNLRQFNGITVMMLPDIEHRYEPPKIAIQQFALFPR